MSSTKKSTTATTARSTGTSSSYTRKRKKMDPSVQKYYAVRAGKNPGVYLTWVECQSQTAGYRGAQYKSFISRADAQAFVEGRNPSTATDGTKETRYYAVAVGRDPGIYTDWSAAALAIKGWKGPKYRRFDTRREAVDYIRANGDQRAQEVLRLQEGGASAGYAREDDDDDDEPEFELKVEDDDEDEDDEEEDQPPAKKSKKGAGHGGGGLGADEEENIPCIYTDGSSLANGRAGAVAGVGVYFGAGDPRNISEPLQGEVQTNQRAELTAILRALEASDPARTVRIYTDSRYSISCVTDWYRAWQKDGWRTRDGPVKNRDLVEAVRRRIDARDARGARTLFQWVKGHAGDAGNVAADSLAVRGARRA